MSNNERYFRLKDEVGLHAETGDHQPLTEVGVVAAIPTMVRGEVVREVKRFTIRPANAAEKTPPPAEIVEGTRVILSRDLAIADALIQSGQYEECRPPTAKQSEKERSTLQAAHDRAVKVREENEEV